MSVQHVHAVFFMLHLHAAFPCFISVKLVHAVIHSECPCDMSMSVLHVHAYAACLCCVLRYAKGLTTCTYNTVDLLKCPLRKQIIVFTNIPNRMDSTFNINPVRQIIQLTFKSTPLLINSF